MPLKKVTLMNPVNTWNARNQPMHLPRHRTVNSTSLPCERRVPAPSPAHRHGAQPHASSLREWLQCRPAGRIAIGLRHLRIAATEKHRFGRTSAFAFRHGVLD